MASAKISTARVAAAHDGEAELIISIQFETGGSSEISLDKAASAYLMDACNAGSLEDLQGHDWQHVRAALQVSYNRFQ